MPFLSQIGLSQVVMLSIIQRFCWGCVGWEQCFTVPPIVIWRLMVLLILLSAAAVEFVWRKRQDGARRDEKSRKERETSVYVAAWRRRDDIVKKMKRRWWNKKIGGDGNPWAKANDECSKGCLGRGYGAHDQWHRRTGGGIYACVETRPLPGNNLWRGVQEVAKYMTMCVIVISSGLMVYWGGAGGITQRLHAATSFRLTETALKAAVAALGLCVSVVGIRKRRQNPICVVVEYDGRMSPCWTTRGSTVVELLRCCCSKFDTSPDDVFLSNGG